MLLGSLLALTSCATNDYNSNHSSSYAHDQENGNPAHNTNQAKKDIISMERIKELMKRGSEDEILKEEYENKTIEHLVYNHENPKESAKKYKEFVFQEDKKPEERNPVLVFFNHGGSDVESDPTGVGRREAIIFKEIERIYGDKINSLYFRIDWPTDENGKPTKDPKKIPYGGNLEKLIGTWIRAAPSLALYGQFDLLKGETEEKNDGKIKHLDTLFGGPRINEDIDKVIYNCRYCWINPNVFNISSDGNVYRHNNEWDPKLVIDKHKIVRNKQE